ncbi:MAG: ABC-type nitrate/sulfonate/bicarbonate transport system substrate-binding protein [Alphaproteobacteria bacterium]|jgi:ABC-type nitrate/sulfonate/bicarbonate transport system substrate-binding protein
MDHISFPYRAHSHLALMHVIAETGAWARQDLDVDYQRVISREDAHELVPKGEIEFVSGNHVSTYAARARGDTWTYVGQSMSNNNVALVAHPDTGIQKIADLRERKVGARGNHPYLNVWLYLKQHGLDADKDEVELIRRAQQDVTEPGKGPRKTLIDMVSDKDVDACFLNKPSADFARRKGLTVIDVDPQHMIFYMTMSTSKKMVDERPDVVERVLKGIIEGIAYFKINREETIQILIDRYDNDGKLDRELAENLYDDLAPKFEPCLYPSMRSIANVYQEALKQDEKNGDAAKIHPLALWDFHFLRQIDDSGFVRNLYKDHPELLTQNAG